MFENTGAGVLSTIKGKAIFFGVATLLAALINPGVAQMAIVVGLFGGIFWVYKNYNNPRTAIFQILGLSFLISGFSRIVALPFGLSYDGILFMTWIGLLLKGKSKEWKYANNLGTWVFAGWGVFCVLQILNPLSPSLLAWFYAARGLSLQSALFLPLVFILFYRPSDYKKFIAVWFIASIALGLYAAKQYWLGIFSFEQRWLDQGGSVTHVLWGRFTRMFSFLSDANQFGNAQAHTGIVATIILLGKQSKKVKLFAAITAAICFYGMLISGTRGAIVVPGVAFIVYIILSKNFKLMIIGSIFGAVMFHILANTFLFHNVEAVRRMRTAFNATEDASFNVRVENRRILDNYMKDKPFGGGIGSAGVWGQRFSPNSFLAHFETDGHYVRIYAETGIIGLWTYIILFAALTLKMSVITWRLKHPSLKNIAGAFTAGLVAILAANYSAAVIIGLPTAIVICFHIGFVFMCPIWESKMIKKDFINA